VEEEAGNKVARPINTLNPKDVQQRATKRPVGLSGKQFKSSSHVHTKKSSNVVPTAWSRKTGRAATMIESFYHAFHGIYVGLKEERNVRIHFAAVAVVILLGSWLKLDVTSWIELTFAMGLVLVAEFLNTALEHLVNISAAGEYHRSARYAKDTAAAAVLLASLTAAGVGLLVFVPRLLALLH